jgi:hypothetical protein
MKPPLPALDVDLLIEHGVHHMRLKGSETRFAARFSTLSSLWHFLRIFWSYRRGACHEATVQVEWRQFIVPVVIGRQRRSN